MKKQGKKLEEWVSYFEDVFGEEDLIILGLISVIKNKWTPIDKEEYLLIKKVLKHYVDAEIERMGLKEIKLRDIKIKSRRK